MKPLSIEELEISHDFPMDYLARAIYTARLGNKMKKALEEMVEIAQTFIGDGFDIPKETKDVLKLWNEEK